MIADERLLARFFVPSKRERYEEMLSHPKKRRKFLLERCHFKSLDPRYLLPLDPKKLCIPGKLAFYEGEDMGHRWILERRD